MDRLSTSRRSSVSINKRGGYETIKDPRPLNDKGFRDRALQDLIRVIFILKKLMDKLLNI